MTIDSKTVLCQTSDEKMFGFLSDFNNFTRLMPSQVEGWSVNGNTCTFKVGGFMQITLAYTEKIANSRLVVAPAADSNSPIPFKMIVNITNDSASTCRVSISFNLEGSNPMMNMMIKPKLRDAADRIVDQLQYFATGL